MKLSVYILVWVALLIGSCSRFDSLPSVESTLELPNAHWEVLRNNYFGKPYTIYEPMCMEGFVTANDIGGNFYRSIVVCDETCSIELSIGFSNLHTVYPVGQRLIVEARGLAVGMYNGVLQLGLRSDGWQSAVEPFGSRVVVDSYVLRDNGCNMVQPATKATLETLTERMCGQLVCVENLKKVDSEANAWFEDMGLSNSYTSFADNRGLTVRVQVSRYASFASEPIPTQEITITGILYRDSAGYLLKPRSRDDIDLSSES